MRPFLLQRKQRKLRAVSLLLLRRRISRRRLHRRRHRIRVVAEAVRLPKRTAIISSRLRAILQRLRSESLQQRLIGCSDQAVAGLGGGIVHKLPLVVFLLLVELANGGFLADAGHSHNWPARDRLLSRRLIPPPPSVTPCSPKCSSLNSWFLLTGSL